MVLAARWRNVGILAVDQRWTLEGRDGTQRFDIGGKLLRTGRYFVAGAGDAATLRAGLRAVAEEEAPTYGAIGQTLTRRAWAHADRVRGILPDAQPERTAFFAIAPDAVDGLLAVYFGSGGVWDWTAAGVVVAMPPEMGADTRGRTAELRDAVTAADSLPELVRIVARAFADAAFVAPSMSPTFEAGVTIETPDGLVHQRIAGRAATLAHATDAEILDALQPALEGTVEAPGYDGARAVLDEIDRAVAGRSLPDELPVRTAHANLGTVNVGDSGEGRIVVQTSGITSGSIGTGTSGSIEGLRLSNSASILIGFDFSIGANESAIRISAASIYLSGVSRVSTLELSGDFVSKGANDSAGAGWRLLRVPNS